ncbi:hypothetical protein, partial [Secundilactobacillus kimchicus]
VDNATAPLAENQIRVNFKDASGKVVATKTYTNNNFKSQAAKDYLTTVGDTTVAGQTLSTKNARLLSTLVSGYTLEQAGTDGIGLSAAQYTANQNAVAAAQYGSDVNLTVVPVTKGNLFGTSTATTAKFILSNGQGIDAKTNVFDNGTLAAVAQKLATQSQTAGAKGDKITLENVRAAVKAAGADTLYTVYDTNAAIAQGNEVAGASNIVSGHTYTAFKLTFTGDVQDGDTNAKNAATIVINGQAINLYYTSTQAQTNVAATDANKGNIISAFNFNQN